MRGKKRIRLTAVSLIVWGLIASYTAIAQQVLLDKPLRAGELTLFQSMADENVFYYVVDKPRLATNQDGNPQFSFLRYVSPVRAGEEGEQREGEGGGIVHALVELKVTDEQLNEATQELRRLRSGARIEGPVIFQSGTFGLVSAFKDADGKLTSKVIGLGKAPILDGQKASISMLVTKLGSKILWESFQTPTPDISFTFEMEMEGYQSPRRALIEADFDQIYEHQGFGAGGATPYVGAEIKATFDDLRRTGAIKLTQVGSDEKLEGLITTAYNKIADMMFSPLGGTGTPSLSNLTAGAGSKTSLLDKANTFLDKRRAETQKENERIRKENKEAEERGRREEAAAKTAEAKRKGEKPAKPPKATDEVGPTRNLAAREKGIKSPETKDTKKIGKVSHEEAEKKEKAEGAKEKDLPSFAAIASFEMKRVRQRGKFKIDLNKYTTDRITLRFDENIGNLKEYWGNNDYFRQVNLDDPLFKQRNILVFVDGLNAKDFGEYINFVNVQMRKKHQGGEETFDEVRIDRNNFNTQANNFRMLYGWKNDNDRDEWFEYEFRPMWSFFGGKSVEQDWSDTTANALNLAPPYQKRSVDIEADPELLSEAGIRLITVKIHYDLAGAPQVKQVTLNPSKNEVSKRVDFMLPANQLDYEYEVTWRLKGRKTVSSERERVSDSVLFVDELPNT